jgi:hypothetical protein
MKRIIRRIPLLFLTLSILKKLFLDAILYRKVKYIPRIRLTNYLASSRELFFVLGTGESINNISKTQWNIISKNKSVGVNKWVLHDFVPNIYSFEMSEQSQFVNTKIVYDYLFSKKDLYQDTPILLRFNSLAQIDDLDFRMINAYRVLFVDIPGDNINEFRRFIKVLSRYRLPYYFRNSIIFQKRASIIAMVLLGYQLGYKEIVLCGVDLINTKYFWHAHKKNFKNHLILPSTGQESNQHHSTLFGEMNVISVLDVINQELLIPNKVILSSISSNKLLEKIGIYPNCKISNL